MPVLLTVDICANSLAIICSTSLAITVLGSGRRNLLNLYFALFAIFVAAWATFSLLLHLSLWFHTGNPPLMLELTALYMTLCGPFFLLFARRYVKWHSHWPDVVSGFALALTAALSYQLFMHRFVSNPRLVTNGATLFDVGVAGIVAGAVGGLPLACALVLFWARRKDIRAPFIWLSASLVLAGLVMGRLAGIGYPLMSIANAAGIGILGFGVIRRRLFNPLRDLNEQLELKVVERTHNLEQARADVERTVEERTSRLLQEIAERGKAEESLAERANRLELIAQIGQKTTALLGLDELLQQAVTLIRDAFKYASVDIFLIQEDSLVLRASTAGSAYPHVGEFGLKVGEEGIIGYVAASGEPILVPDVSREPRYIALPEGSATRSELAVPIRLRGKVIGVLDAQSTRVDAFTQLDLFTQRTIADQLSNAIDNVRLYDQLIRRAQRLTLVTRISAAVSAVLNIPDLMESVYREVTPIFAADAFFIALTVEEKDVLDFRIHVDRGIRGTPERAPVGAGLASRIIREKRSLLVNGPSPDLEMPSDSAGKSPSSWLGVPMLIGERPIGVICVQTYAPRPYDEDDRALLWAVADQVAVAVENARLYDALRLELSERERTEKGLRESEEQFRNLADQSPNMIFINKNGKVVYANPQCETRVGYTREQFCGPDFKFNDLTAPEYRETVTSNFRRHLRGEEVDPYEYALITRNGHRIDAIITTKLIHHAGEPAILGIITDITARKRTEKLLRSLNAAALAMEQALTPHEIFAAAVRELGILGFTCSVLFTDPSKRKLALRYANGVSPGEFFAAPGGGEDGWVPVDISPAISAAIETRKTVFTQFDAEYLASKPTLALVAPQFPPSPPERVRTILSPLAVGEDVFGLLAVHGESLGEEDLDVIAAFAHQAAAAWRKTALMQDLEHSLEELRTTQDLLLHAQKMEAIGRLAGGIAHDFNNVLTVISGFTSLLSDSLEGNTPALEDLSEIKNAIKRAAALTSRLLAFSRRQILRPEILDFNSVISGCAKLLRPLIGEDIKLVINPSPRLGRIKADPYQIDQVIINLAVNARDAMPGGGTLTLETSDHTLATEEAAAYSVSQGPYVCLAVRDTGIGMSEDIKRHIFEPFFTTKADGRGTGLGLSTVYGIVKQTGGAISVESKPGSGSVFTIYLPAVWDERTPSPVEPHDERPPCGTGTILLVEDDDTVRDLAARIIRNAGYTVLNAASGEEAIRIASGPQEIRLMITDVVMPGIHGVELAHRITELRPDMAVLFMSGYTDDPSIHLGVPDGLPFLSKPFQPEELLKKVAEFFGESPPST